jgi:hypothetical protein
MKPMLMATATATKMETTMDKRAAIVKRMPTRLLADASADEAADESADELSGAFGLIMCD